MMLRTQIAAAIGCARAHALDEIMREVWTRHATGQLSDDEAGQLSALAQERKDTWRGIRQAVPGLVLPPLAEPCPAPVRRRSHLKGRSEKLIWRPTNRQEVQRVLLAAKRYELFERKKGKRTGPLGSVAIEVLEFFVNLVDFRTGRLEPSIHTIMCKVRRSRDAVVRALKALRAHGFLDWLRRYEPTGNEGRGPQVQQASNAYRLSLPEKAIRLLGRFGKAPPPPEDHRQDHKAWMELINAYRTSLPMDEQLQFSVDDPGLRVALAKLWRSVNQRESAKRIESQSSYILNMKPKYSPLF